MDSLVKTQPKTPRAVKDAAEKKTAALKTTVTWPNVLRAIQAPQAREFVLGRFKASGFDAGSWSLRTAKAHMAHCLTAAEDMLEPKAGTSNRQALADVKACRRRLELELWP